MDPDYLRFVRAASLYEQPFVDHLRERYSIGRDSIRRPHVDFALRTFTFDLMIHPDAMADLTSGDPKFTFMVTPDPTRSYASFVIMTDRHGERMVTRAVVILFILLLVITAAMGASWASTG